MNVGALIVTTGLPRISGVAALLPEVGAISAGQRMIAAFQRCGAAMTALVVGPEEKRLERQLAQNGVVFLRCRENTSFLEGVREGLRFAIRKYNRVFVVPGDTPLFLPNTLEALLASEGPIAVPVYKYVHGCPVLLDRSAMEQILLDPVNTDFAQALLAAGLPITYVETNDSGILLRGENMPQKTDSIQLQDRQLTRPMVDISLTNGAELFDQRLSMLLHLISDTGSVRDACSLMQISYSAAWNMLNHAEDELGYPLVARIRGGSSGSGSLLTEKGRLLMDAYDRYAAHLRTAAQTLYEDYFGGLLEIN